MSLTRRRALDDNGLMFATALFALSLTQADPYAMSIGTPGKASISCGYTDLRTGRAVTAQQVAAMADGVRFVFVGESHDVAAHHRAQAELIDALVARGRRVTVGFEMFSFDNQSNLNPWTLGWWSEAEFVDRVGWKRLWGFDYALYRPVFESVRRNRLPMAALNVPRDWARTVARNGWEGLKPEQQALVPGGLDLSNAQHRALFGALLGGHPPTGGPGERMYAAQVLWDSAMAANARKAMEPRLGNPKAVMVVLAGIGHTLYGLGINGRLREPSLNVACLESDAPRTVSRGLADVAFLSEPERRKSER